MRKGVNSVMNQYRPHEYDRNAVDLDTTIPTSAWTISAHGRGQESGRMKFIVKAIAILVVLGMIGLTGFAYLGDLSPDQSVITKPVVLDGQ